jgi:hypothetical protein
MLRGQHQKTYKRHLMGAIKANRATWTGMAAAILAFSLTAAHAEKVKPVPIVLWFNATLRIQGAPLDRAVTLCAKRQVVSWVEGRKTVSVAIPDATISFKPWETESWTWYGGGKWDTSAPAVGNSMETFMGGVSLPLLAGVSAIAHNMSWRVEFESDTPGLTVFWNWGAAPYLRFTDDFNALKIVPMTNRTQKAGFPKAFKLFAALAGTDDERGARFTGPRSATFTASAPQTFGCGGGY